MILARDQYGQEVWLKSDHPRKELLEWSYRKHASKVYRDKEDGRTVHVGYVIGGSWWTLYNVEPWEREA